MAIMDTNSESNHQYQYIQDTSLASLDSKTSPLAMLVRTCSQIGADPPMAAAAKSKKPGAAGPVSATPASAADRPHSASPAAYLGHAAAKHHHRNHNNNYMEEPPKPVAKLNFKPYENTVLTPSPHHQPQQHHQHHTQSHGDGDGDGRPKSSSSEDNSSTGGHGRGKKRKSSDDYSHHGHGGPASKSSRRSSSSASSEAAVVTATTTDPSTNPIIRSGLEVMHGAAAAKAFCPPLPLPAHSPYKPDALTAFRHTYLPGSPWMPAAVSLAAAAAAKPPPHSPSSSVSVPAGDCKDPMCGGPATGCAQQQQQQHAAAAAALAFATQYHPMMAAAAAAGGCPAGCAQCDHQRWYLPSLMAAASVPASFYAPIPRSYTCSWVVPGGTGSHHHRSTSPSSSPAAAEAAAVPSLCGKSFGTSEELLQHIRTHTSGSGHSVAAMAAGVGPMSPTTAAAFSAYNSHLSRHLFHHPSAAAYGKLPLPPSASAMMPPSPYSAFNPTAAYCYPPPPSSSAHAAAAAAAAAAAYHHHPLYASRGDTSAATVSR